MRALALLPALLLALPAAAAIPPSESGRTALARFNALDRDHDGGLSRNELLSRGKDYAAETLFLLLDADGDGRISAREMEGAGGGGRLARFDAYDVDKSGFVTRREFPNRLDRVLFEALDRNHDHRLALAELRPAFAGSRARRDPEPAAAPRRNPPEERHTACWIPSARDWRFDLEFPVPERCRPR